jgi:hypothetical protein
LFALWVALLGADRVSLLDTVTPFVMTPFLALTPIVIASEWLRHAAHGRRIIVPGPALGYAVVAAALAAIVLASVSMSADPTTSAARAALFIAQIGGTFVVAVMAADREDFAGLLARAAIAGIAAFAAFDVLSLAAWVGAIPGTLHFGTVAVNLEPSTYAGFIPRLSGPVADPNRTGWVLLFMMYLIALRERHTTIHRIAMVVAIVLILLTLSRSASAAVVATLLALAIGGRPKRVRISSLVAFAVATAALLTLLLVTPDSTTLNLNIFAPVAERFSVAQGSALEHFQLLRRGVDEATSSVPRVLLGLGFGSSYLALQDMFPGNRYGNFHSLYVTMFADAGVFALILSLVLLGWPLIRGGPYRALVLGAAVFSVFYQATTDPAFWLALALAWIFVRRMPTTARALD